MSTEPPTSTEEPPGPPGAAPGASAPGAPASGRNRFLTWLREIDLPRRPGWVGGVCAGIAARLGIDPLIVRGVVLVVAVLGGPAILLYAVAWFLLPDEDDHSHVEDALTGTLTRSVAGIGALVLLSFLPVAQGFWSLGDAYWGSMLWAPGFGRGAWTLVLVGLLTWWLIWVARRSGRGTADARRPAFSPEATDPTADPAATAVLPGSAATAVLPGSAATVPLVLAPAPPRPASGTPEDLAAWRGQQAAWAAERDAFRAQAQATARETAQRRSEEARRRSAAATAARLERHREWLRANPAK